MDKQTVVDLYNGILYSNKTERTTYTSNNMDESKNIMLVKIWYNLGNNVKIWKHAGIESG